MKKYGPFCVASMFALTTVLSTTSCGGGSHPNDSANTLPQSAAEGESAKDESPAHAVKPPEKGSERMPGSHATETNAQPSSGTEAAASMNPDNERDPVQVALEREYLAIFVPMKRQFDDISFLNRYRFNIGGGEYEGETIMQDKERKAHGLGKISYDNGASLITKLVFGKNSLPVASVFTDSKKGLVCVGRFQHFLPLETETYICLEDGKYRRTTLTTK